MAGRPQVPAQRCSGLADPARVSLVWKAKCRPAVLPPDGLGSEHQCMGHPELPFAARDICQAARPHFLLPELISSLQKTSGTEPQKNPMLPHLGVPARTWHLGLCRGGGGGPRAELWDARTRAVPWDSPSPHLTSPSGQRWSGLCKPEVCPGDEKGGDESHSCESRSDPWRPAGRCPDL